MPPNRYASYLILATNVNIASWYKYKTTFKTYSRAKCKQELPSKVKSRIAKIELEEKKLVCIEEKLGHSILSLD